MFWIAVAVVIVVLGAIIFARKQRSRDEHPSFLYKRRAATFSPAERSFLGVLDLAAGKDFRVFGKVRVSDLLAPQDGTNYGTRTAAQNSIDRLHFDFALCKPRDLSVLCVIQLIDRTRRQKNRQAHDAVLADACQSAGLPMITFDARYAYSPSEVSARIAEAISATVLTHVEPSLHAFDPHPMLRVPDSDSPLAGNRDSEATGRKWS